MLRVKDEEGKVEGGDRSNVRKVRGEGHRGGRSRENQVKDGDKCRLRRVRDKR